MTRLFLTPKFDPAKPAVYLVDSYFNRADIGKTLFTNKTPDDYAYTTFTFAEDVNSCDYLMIPQDVRTMTAAFRTYLDEQITLARSINKKILLFIGGDLSHTLSISDPEVIVFKGSQYRYLKQPNEIIVPPFAEDLMQQYHPKPRTKSDKLVVGFCGWAGFDGVWTALKFWVKHFGIIISSVWKRNAAVHKKGIWYRRRAIAICKRAPKVNTNFIVRNTFSASKHTISLDPKTARREYVDSIINSDVTLAPKGDGNFSVRFYETLALGRIPVLIDTDVVLPLEQHIDYDEVIIRIPYQHLDQLPQILADWYHNLTDEVFVQKQKRAYELFTKNLRYDAFWNTIFNDPVERLLEPRNP